MRSSAPSPLVPLFGALALLATLGLSGCDAPEANAGVAPSVLAWRDGLERAVDRYRDETRSSETRLRREQKALHARGDAEGARRNYLSYCRTHQRLAMVTIRAIDELGEPPRDGRRLVDLLRRLLKHRLNDARKGAEAVMAFDFARADRLADNSERDEVPLRRAILDEIERLAPGTARERASRERASRGRAANAAGSNAAARVEETRW